MWPVLLVLLANHGTGSNLGDPPTHSQSGPQISIHTEVAPFPHIKK